MERSETPSCPVQNTPNRLVARECGAIVDFLRIKTSDILNFHNETHYESVIVMPAVKMAQATRAADVMIGRTEAPGLLVVAEDDCRLGFIATANYVYTKTRSRYFGYVAQDAFAGYYWLETALETMQSNDAGLLAFNDGRFFGRLAAFGFADRQWTDSLYTRFLFHPQYTKHYADTELSDLALLAGKLVYNPHCMMIEVDYEKHRGASASTVQNNIHYETAADPDGILYVKRALAGFDGKVQPFVPSLGPVAVVLAELRQQDNR